LTFDVQLLDRLFLVYKRVTLLA